MISVRKKMLLCSTTLLASVVLAPATMALAQAVSGEVSTTNKSPSAPLTALAPGDTVLDMNGGVITNSNTTSGSAVSDGSPLTTSVVVQDDLVVTGATTTDSLTLVGDLNMTGTPSMGDGGNILMDGGSISGANSITSGTVNALNVSTGSVVTNTIGNQVGAGVMILGDDATTLTAASSLTVAENNLTFQMGSTPVLSINSTGTTIDNLLSANGGIVTNNLLSANDGIFTNGSDIDLQGFDAQNNLINGNISGVNNITASGTITAGGGIEMGTGTITDSSGNVIIADNLDVSGNIVGGNQAGTNTIGGALATQSNLQAGTSYVTVNQNSVVLHGGTTSTTQTLDNSGLTLSDTTNGVTFTVGNTGNTMIAGNLDMTNGNINNVNVLNSTTINNSGDATITGDLEVGGNLSLASGLAVTGAASFAGGASIANGLTVTSGGASIKGNSSVTGNFAVTGNVAVTGNYATTDGDITTTNGTVTGKALVATGAASVGTNLTVGGAVTVTGNYTTAAGNIQTGTGQVKAGAIVINGGNGGKITGLTSGTLSATSTDAVTGSQLFATNQTLAALDQRETEHFNLLSRRADRAYQGIAMGLAMNAAPLNLADGESGIAGGVGTFEGQWAGAIRLQAVTEDGIGLGANVGFGKNSFGAAVGASKKF